VYKDAKSSVFGGALFVVAGIVPLYEEALFTYLPQSLGKKVIKDSKIRSWFNLLPATVFGLMHYPNSYSYVQVVHTGLINVLHQRYLLKRNANKVPYLNHSLNNLLAFGPPFLFLGM